MADEKLLSIHKRAKERLFQIPGVHGVGIGPKEVGGRLTAEPAIKIVVLQKRPTADVPPGELIPPEIEGVKTDVVVSGRIRRRAALPSAVFSQAIEGKLADTGHHRPLRAGTALCPKGRQGVGTLGVFCLVEGDDENVVALTALHNIFDYVLTDTPDHWMRKKVGQPTGRDTCCKSSSHIFGKVIDAAPALDAALVRLDHGQQYKREIQGIGRVRGAHALTSEEVHGGTPFLVKKRGAYSGITGGFVSLHHTDIDVDVHGHTQRFEGVHFIRPNPLPTRAEGGVFAVEGDSGCAVLDEQNRVIGLLVGGSDPTEVEIGGTKMIVSADIAVPIQDIFDHFANQLPEGIQLRLSIAVAAQEGEVFTIPRLALASPGAAVAPEDADELEPRPIEDDARRTRIGGWYADLYYRHRDEIEALVNGNRHVAAVWHRRGGAALMHAFGRVLRQPEQRVPATLEGRSLDDCMEAFARALFRFGSEPLRRDLAAVRPTLPELAGRSYDELLAALAAADRTFAAAGT
jgi:hypothetical protein